MFTCKEYRRVETLEEAWELNQKRSNLLIGGMLWAKMGQRSVQTVIDLSGLGLDQIEESEEEFRIGCMATLRQMELHEGLNRYTGGAVRESVRHIVGVQFRNVATVGGSVFGRFGFSDVLTMLLAMDSYVELYKGGILPLAEFVNQKRDRDVLVRVIVKKTPASYAYQSMRAAKTDFPTLVAAVARTDDRVRISVGARPARAVRIETQWTDPQQLGVYAAEQIAVGSNLRGSAQYRRELVRVLVKRACLALDGQEGKEGAGC